MKLFQYWDQPEPPAEVAALTAAVARDNPGFDYRRYDHEAAATFIATHYGERERAAFAACAVPAMQADYVRLCLLDTCGGLYVDADLQSVAPLDGLIANAGRIVLTSTFAPLLCNSMMFARAPRQPFVRACLALSTDNLLTRRFEDVLVASGPGVLTAVRYVAEPEGRQELSFSTAMAGWGAMGWDALLAAAHATIAPGGEPPADLVASWRDATVVSFQAREDWLVHMNPAYKSGGRHWKNWTGSIYRTCERASASRSEAP